MVTVAAIQTAASGEVERNLAHLIELTVVAAERGAKLVCLPQLCCTPWFPAEPAQGPPLDDHRPLLERFAAVARERQVHMIVPLPERDGDRWYNTAFHLDAAGEVAASHRKRQLPEIDGYHEQSCFTPGDGPPTCLDVDGLKVGVQICWESYFPEGARLLALSGAELLFAPTAAAYDTQARWQALLTTHALCNNLFVLRLNRMGDEGKLRFYGRSFVADPYGTLVTEAGEGESILMAEIDPAVVAEARKRTRFLADRRPESYGGLTTKGNGRRQ